MSHISTSEDYQFGNWLHIEKEGNVGIGTKTPQAALHISGSGLIINTPLSGSGTAFKGEIRWSIGADGKGYLWLCTGSTGGWVGVASTV